MKSGGNSLPSLGQFLQVVMASVTSDQSKHADKAAKIKDTRRRKYGRIRIYHTQLAVIRRSLNRLPVIGATVDVNILFSS